MAQSSDPVKNWQITTMKVGDDPHFLSVTLFELDC